MTLAIGAYCSVGAGVFGWMAAHKAAALRRVRMHSAILRDKLQDARQRRDEYKMLFLRELRREDVLLASIVDAAKDRVTQTLKDKKHRLSISLPREQVWIHADSARIARALATLLHTVADASIEKSTLACNAHLQEGMIRIEIGNAMSAEAVQAVSGKELAYARVMAKLHEGRMEAGRQEKSFQFALFLPVVSAPPHARQQQALHPSAPNGSEMAAL